MSRNSQQGHFLACAWQPFQARYPLICVVLCEELRSLVSQVLTLQRVLRSLIVGCSVVLPLPLLVERPEARMVEVEVDSDGRPVCSETEADVAVEVPWQGQYSTVWDLYSTWRRCLC